MRLKLYLFVLFQVLFTLNSISQEKPNITIYSNVNGLPYCDINGSEYFSGIFWVATDKGLFVKKKDYFVNASEVLSNDFIDSSTVLSIHLIHDKRELIVVTPNALFSISDQLNPHKKLFIHKLCNTPRPFKNGYLRWDKEGILWNCELNRVYCIAPLGEGGFRTFIGFREIETDSLQNILLISNQDSLFKARFENSELVTIPLELNGANPHFNYFLTKQKAMVCIQYRDSDKLIEVRNNDAFLVYEKLIRDSNTGNKEKYNWSVENYRSCRTYSDSSVWISHARCLVNLQFSNKCARPTNIKESCRGILYSDATRKVLCSTYGGIYEGYQLNYKICARTASKKAYYNLALQLNDTMGYLFPEFGTLYALMYNLKSNSFIVSSFGSISKQLAVVYLGDRNYLFAGDSLNIFTLNGNDFQFSKNIPSALEQHYMLSPLINHCLLVGSNSGLRLLDLRTNNLKFISRGDFRCAELVNNCWLVGNNGNGLWLIDSVGNVIRRDNSAKIKSVFSMIADPNPGFYWLGTNQGLLLYSIDQGVVCKLDKHHGLNNVEYNTNSMKLTPNGDLYAGGLNGLDLIHTRLIFDELTKNVKPEIAMVEVFDKTLSKGQMQVLTETSGKIVAEPGELSLCVYLMEPENKGFNKVLQYRIPELDSVWKNFESGDTLLIGHLSAGDYIINVRNTLCKDPSAFNSIAIHVPFSFTKTRAYKVIQIVIAILLAGAVFVFLRKRVKKYKQMKLAAEMSSVLKIESELKALKFSINLHTFSNFITSLQRLVLEEKNEIAVETLKKYSDFVRIQMKYSEGSWVSLAQEIEFIIKYIEVESNKLRQAVSIKISNEVTNVSDIFIPNMAILPFVENAFKHGLNVDIEGGVNELVLHFNMNKGNLQCKIINSSIRKFVPEVNSGFRNKGSGNEITNKRMKLYAKLTNKKWSMKTDSYVKGEKTITVVTLKLPYEIRSEVIHEEIL